MNPNLTLSINAHALDADELVAAEIWNSRDGKGHPRSPTRHGRESAKSKV